MHKNKPKNFAPEKQRKRGNRTRFGPKKAKPGAFWVLEGMGTVEDGSNQMRKPSVRTKVNHKTMQHMQKENRQKPSVFAGFVAGAEGLVSAAASVGAGRSPQATSAPRHAVLEWMWESAPGSEEGSVLPDFLDKSETGWCCFGAVGKIGTVMDGKFPILGTIALFGKI